MTTRPTLTPRLARATWNSLSAHQRKAIEALAAGRSMHRIRAGWTTGNGDVLLAGTADSLEARGLATKRDFGLHITDRGRELLAMIRQEVAA